jgi:hypothetical protein
MILDRKLLSQDHCHPAKPVRAGEGEESSFVKRPCFESKTAGSGRRRTRREMQ